MPIYEISSFSGTSDVPRWNGKRTLIINKILYFPNIYRITIQARYTLSFTQPFKKKPSDFPFLSIVGGNVQIRAHTSHDRDRKWDEHTTMVLYFRIFDIKCWIHSSPHLLNYQVRNSEPKMTFNASLSAYGVFTAQRDNKLIIRSYWCQKLKIEGGCRVVYGTQG